MKVAIAGFAQEGKINYEYWSKLGADITIVDEKDDLKDVPEGISTILGKGAFERLNGFDLVVRTASLNPNHIKTDGKIWSATNEFFAKCPAPIIGVTGTKGKGTTCSLIAGILKEAGKTVHLVGNIGVPALGKLEDIKQDDIVVFELSSFQLWDLEKSPETAVVLMMEADHMDVHSSMAEYVEAKANIGRFQTEEDLLVYHPTNEISAEIASVSKAVKKRFMTEEGASIVIPAEVGISKSSWIPDQVWNDGAGEWITINDQPVCLVSEVGLLGAHNIENICAAVTASWKYAQDVSSIKQSVIDFKGLPHRLEFVREIDGVRYYNDSFSSAQGATIAALNSFKKDSVVLICGGYDKGASFKKLADKASESTNIKHIILVGEVRNMVASKLDEVGFSGYEVLEHNKLQPIIEQAQFKAERGDVVLFSPGTSSYDMFENFEDRGNQYKKIVSNL
jgi:UDP-N-acetylmuramoylalanine--D-glutamate ligase